MVTAFAQHQHPKKQAQISIPTPRGPQPSSFPTPEKGFLREHKAGKVLLLVSTVAGADVLVTYLPHWKDFLYVVQVDAVTILVFPLSKPVARGKQNKSTWKLAGDTVNFLSWHKGNISSCCKGLSWKQRGSLWSKCAVSPKHSHAGVKLLIQN